MAYIILVPSISYSFAITPENVSLMCAAFRPSMSYRTNKRGWEDQSTDEKQDEVNALKESVNTHNENLKKIDELSSNDLDRLDQGLPVRPIVFSKAKSIEEEYPIFFDEDSDNQGNRKKGYAEVKGYLEEEIKALQSMLGQTSIMEDTTDRERGGKKAQIFIIRSC